MDRRVTHLKIGPGRAVCKRVLKRGAPSTKQIGETSCTMCRRAWMAAGFQVMGWPAKEARRMARGDLSA